MEFFKGFRQERQGRKVLETLSPDFQIHEGPWLFNREFDMSLDPGESVKTRFAFDDASELKSTDLMAKIGINTDRAIPHPFIGFAYARMQDQARLEEYAKQYKWAELITNLTREGGSTDSSKYIPLTDTAQHD